MKLLSCNFSVNTDCLSSSHADTYYSGSKRNQGTEVIMSLISSVEICICTKPFVASSMLCMS
jgi:hypothetical protein